MTKYVFYLKEALFKPSAFFKHQNDNPNIIHVHWIIIPAIIFIVISLVHWVSTTVTLNEIELDFEGFLFVHIEHLIFGITLSLFIWFRTWISLKYIGKINNRTPEITAWCNTPYMVILFILLCVFIIYFSIFGNAANVPVDRGPSITSVQHGTGIFRIAILISDIWCIFLMYNAVSVLNKMKIKKFLLGAIIIFFLPSLILMII